MWMLVLVSECGSVLKTYCSGLYIALYQLSGCGIGADLTRAVYHVSDDEALVEDRDRLGCLVGKNDLLAERHFDGDSIVTIIFLFELNVM